MFPPAYSVYFQGGKQTFSTELKHVSPPVLSVNTSHRLEHAPRSWEMSALTRAHRYPDLLSGDVHNKLYTCDGILRSFQERKYTKHCFAFSGFQDRNLLSLSTWNSSHFLRLIYEKRCNTEADANSHLNKLQIISWPKFPVNVSMRSEKGPLWLLCLGLKLFVVPTDWAVLYSRVVRADRNGLFGAAVWRPCSVNINVPSLCGIVWLNGVKHCLLLNGKKEMDEEAEETATATTAAAEEELYNLKTDINLTRTPK